jgi:hypothetical protein
MRGLLVLILALLLPLMAWAADDEQTGVTLCGLCIPCTCELNCVSLELSCCFCDSDAGSVDPIIVEFLGPDASVLGTATLAGPWCGPCCNTGYAVAELDQAVPPMAVEYVKITKPGDDDLCLDWFKLCAADADPCYKTKWYKLFDCCIRVELGNGEEMNDAIVLM